MLEFLGGNVVIVDDDDRTISSRSIRLCAFDDGVQRGRTALHCAVGDADCVELLLEHMSKEGVELKNRVRNLTLSLSLSLSSSTRAKTTATTTCSFVERDDFRSI